jgi:hypothetical protein
MSFPLAGGPPTEVLMPPVGVPINDLPWVDSSGIYILWNNAQNQPTFAYTPPTGGTPTSFGPTLSGASGTYDGTSFVAIGGSAYALVNQAASPTASTTLFKATPPTGAGSTIATWSAENTTGLIGDSNGMYVIASGGNSRAIYSVDRTTGAQTMFWAPIGGAGLDEEVFALDAQNLYFATVGAGMITLYAKPR